MTTINEELRIYRIGIEELTVKQIRRIINGWEDQNKIGGLTLFYDMDTDRLLVTPSTNEAQIDLCIKALSSEPDVALEKLEVQKKQLRLDVNREICAILQHVVKIRQEKRRNQPMEVNPNSRFISVGGDIFQISKIVSVKKRDDGNRYYIDFYITNQRASIRKEFDSKLIRDSEFVRIQQTLVSAA